MAEMETLHDAFLDELRDSYDAEKQLTKALAKLAKAASNPKLTQAFESHLQETQGQIARLEQVFESVDEKEERRRVRSGDRAALRGGRRPSALAAADPSRCAATCPTGTQRAGHDCDRQNIGISPETPIRPACEELRWRPFSN